MAQDASSLFQQGLAAFQNGDTAKACSLFEQSYGLDAATGTLFNLATCHAKEGRFWQARSEFVKLAGEMDRQGKTDKAKIARDAAADAEKHVPKLALVFPSGSNVQSIEVDGDDLDSAKWKTPIPVARGSHVVTFGADGLKTETRTVNAQEEGAVTIDVPVLSGGASSRRSAATHETQLPDHEPTEEAGWTGQQTTGAIVVGVGVAAVGVGTVFGFKALSQKSDADNACGGSGAVCLDAAHEKVASDQVHTAQDTARISTIAIGGGLVALGVGAYLFFTGKSEAPAQSAGLHVVPTVGRDGGGVSLGAQF